MFDEIGEQFFFENFSQFYQCFLVGDDEECECLKCMFCQQFEDYNVMIVEKIVKFKVFEVEEYLQKLFIEVFLFVGLEVKKVDFLSDKQKFIKIIISLQWYK